MVKNLLLWLVIAAVLLSVFNNFNMKGVNEQVGYSQLIAEIQQDQVTVSYTHLTLPTKA